MILDILRSQQNGVQEISVNWLKNPFMELNCVYLAEPKYLQHEFSFDVKFPNAVGADWLNIGSESLDGRVIVSRSSTGGWVLILEYGDGSFMAAAPLCTKF